MALYQGVYVWGSLFLFIFTIVVQVLVRLPPSAGQSGISMSHPHSCTPGRSGCLCTYSLVLPGLFTQSFPSFLGLHADLFTLQLLYSGFIFLQNTGVPL